MYLIAVCIIYFFNFIKWYNVTLYNMDPLVNALLNINNEQCVSYSMY